ncbi:sulfite-dehydrogenase [Aliivibrio fischeri ES114]|uniref:Sulfite-dehydrogenase n=2 Tax=Aliivibrio fischeri TaxID=668 RepID=Q5E5X5_ALIF1|nr:molybdopterin-dependent oxidoreductase [Aliivibrio fischeri]AAW85571.1 sulfite-dehydrogenase [Aliivibrio fischeri ES114]KLU80153.1 sulfide dehydrogenase [Aliivibrio fischeri]MUK44529.1 molybdopterin-dependent oxidoreductase [Aliivibrio fischeri]MUK79888.1 molybdopterin-dependent oxidoreductase [Aliivibrio fischeri]MUK85600.1 molybdopterin-dependent oxidoreductase [Aliivibrio fischeri]
MEQFEKTPFIEKKPSSLRYYQEGPQETHENAPKVLKVFLPNESKPLEITLDELKNIAPITENRRVVCVCNWSIRRTWTGVLLADVMEYLDIDPNKYTGHFLKQLSFGTDKGQYDSTLSYSQAITNRAMLVWDVDGEPLSLEEGYPLRLIDFSLYRYKGVKCLSELHFTTEFNSGFWEAKAGYCKEGKIKAKRYKIVDLQEHRFIDGTGEVTEF